jgi:hypothetical protein
VPLTDEHTIPEGMGGRHVLPQASCTRCQRIINEEFEQYCQRTLFSNLRAAFGLKSSKKRKRLPHSVKIVTREGDVRRIHKAPEKLPHVYALPVFPNPYFLSRRDLTGNTFGGAWWQYSEKPMSLVLEELGAEFIQTETIWPAKLARFVAKMAHAHAWAVFGPVFEPFLPSIIMGENTRYIEFVGGILSEVEPDSFDHAFKIFRSTRTDDDDSYLVARVRFFASIGAPVYYAVIGRLLEPWPVQERTE